MPITWVVRISLLVAWAASLAFLLRSGIPRGQSKLYIGLPTGVLVLAWAASEAYFESRRKKQLRARFAFLGFVPREDADFHYEPEPGHRNLSVDFNLQADWRGVAIRATEFKYQQGSGKHTTTHRFLQVAADAGDTPAFALAPAKFFARQKSRLTAHEPELGSLIARRWIFIGAEPDEVLDLFPEPLIRWLLEAPRYETWKCADGELSCTWSRGCTPDHAEQLLARLATFLQLLRS